MVYFILFVQRVKSHKNPLTNCKIKYIMNEYFKIKENDNE